MTAKRIREFFRYLDLTPAQAAALRPVLRAMPQPSLKRDMAKGKAALIIVDPQVRYCQPDLYRGTRATDAIMNGILQLRKKFHRKGWLTVIPYMDPDSRGPGHAEGGLYKIKIDRRNDLPIAKKYNDAFYRTNLGPHLHSIGIKANIIVCVHFSFCVKETALASIEAGFKTYIVSDCVANGHCSKKYDTVRDIRKLLSKGVVFVTRKEILTAMESLPAPPALQKREQTPLSRSFLPAFVNYIAAFSRG